MENIHLYVMALIVVLAAIGIGLSAYWTLQPTGRATAQGTAQAEVPENVEINLPVPTVDFGTLDINKTNTTTDDNPAPFQVKNIGSVNINISINASELWGGSQEVDADYQVKCDTDGEASCAGAGSVTTWQVMPRPDASAATGGPNATQIIGTLGPSASSDTENVDINVTVPDDEAQGTKSSSVLFISEAT